MLLAFIAFVSTDITAHSLYASYGCISLLGVCAAGTCYASLWLAHLHHIGLPTARWVNTAPFQHQQNGWIRNTYFSSDVVVSTASKICLTWMCTHFSRVSVPLQAVMCSVWPRPTYTPIYIQKSMYRHTRIPIHVCSTRSTSSTAKIYCQNPTASASAFTVGTRLRLWLCWSSTQLPSRTKKGVSDHSLLPLALDFVSNSLTWELWTDQMTSCMTHPSSSSCV